MVHPVLISPSRRAAWMLAGVLALACSSKRVPIGEQTGSGGANGGQVGSGGGGSTGMGGSKGAGGSTSMGGASGGPDASASGGSGGADAASGGTSGSDAGSGIDAGSCPTSFTSALNKNCSIAADCVLAPHFDCCGNVIVAIRTGTDASFATAQQNFESCVPGCRLRGCDHADKAEDGQTLTTTGQAFAAQCQSGRCTSVVTTGPTSACLAQGSCDPTSSTSCSYCDRGGTLQQFCECTTNGAGQGTWNCGGSMACGSANCGLNGSTCDLRRQTTCEQCDASGARRLCTCVASGSQGVWACNSTASGGCGVDCGGRKCLAGEICVQLGRYPGTFTPDAGPPMTTPTCVVVPDACGANQPSCATCIVSAFGCSTPGTCRDLGPQTFECILPGA